MPHNKLNLYDGDTFEHEGLTFKVTFPYDIDCEPPWERSDGHGVVSEWTRRDKHPGEIELCSDRGSKRFYDVQESTRIAKRDGWGLRDEHQAELLQRLRGIGTRYVSKSRYRVINNIRSDETTYEEFVGPVKPLTAGEITAEAVRRDYEFLRLWANDQWQYVGVVVKLMLEDEDGELVEQDDFEDALWGVETYLDYHMEQAYENAGNVAHQYRKHLAAEAKEATERDYWLEREVLTT
jgi:hypothetical protein